MVNRSVLCISDLHIPFEHRDAFSFVKRIYKDLKCTDVVFIGDVCDMHSISYHEHDPDGWSPQDEIKRAKQRLQKWYKEFPVARICLGNHDRLPDRKAKTSGLPSILFKNFNERWETPSGWLVADEHEIEGVYYIHGEGYSGDTAHLKAAAYGWRNVVMGHLHSVCGIDYMANDLACVWGMSVGCLIDRKTYAFAYNKAFKKKPILAAGVVEYTKHGINPRLFRMDLG